MVTTYQIFRKTDIFLCNEFIYLHVLYIISSVSGIKYSFDNSPECEKRARNEKFPFPGKLKLSVKTATRKPHLGEIKIPYTPIFLPFPLVAVANFKSS